MKVAGLRPNRDIAYHVVRAFFENDRQDLAVAFSRSVIHPAKNQPICLASLKQSLQLSVRLCWAIGSVHEEWLAAWASGAKDGSVPVMPDVASHKANQAAMQRVLAYVVGLLR